MFRASLEAWEAFVSSHSATGKSSVLCVTEEEEEVAECQGQMLHWHPPMPEIRTEGGEEEKLLMP